MDKYYYFISQLPSLSFDRPSSMNIPMFLEEAEKWMSKRDYRLLTTVRYEETAPEKPIHKLWQAYRDFELQFRSDLVRWREEKRKGRELKRLSFPVTLVKEGNPLEIEKNLLLYRWQFIDALEGEHHFDLGFLILYYLKLQILNRLTKFNKEDGAQIFEDTVTAALQKGAEQENATSQDSSIG